MYTVFITGSIPTLTPFFTKYFHKSTISDYHRYDRRNARLNGDDGTTLTSSGVPPGRNDSIEENWMGDRHILMTTKIDIRRDEELERVSP